MSWLSSIEALAHLLERQTQHWICFLHCESPLVARHPQAADQSCTSAVSDPSEEPWIRCFFTAQPGVDCCSFVAREFYSNPHVQQTKAGAFLIPYYPPDEFERPQPVPFLKFSCENFLELRGPISSAEPHLRAGGNLLERCLSDLNEQSNSVEAHCGGASAQLSASAAMKSFDWQPSESKPSLRTMFESLKSLMRDGESYLANASTRLYGPKRSESEVSLSAFVAHWLHSPSRYGVFVGCGPDVPAVVCFSPERFVRRCGRRLTTEPIKGTARVDATQPLLGAEVLWKSVKEMCEQKMVTDLLRNDLNSLCVPGSVCVDAPFAMRRAGDLLQMQSVISGQIQQSQLSHADIFQKMLPAGSVTGTPKYAVGQQLRALEKSPRGYYTGVFALADDAENIESTLLIRGFFASEERWEAGIGAGITTLSDVDFELEEFQLKWQSFAQRWPVPSALAHPFADLAKCRRLLRAHVALQGGEIHSSVGTEVAAEQEDFQSSSESVSAELRALSDGVALRVHELQGRLLFVDHLDSFSGNLLAALREQGCRVARIVSAPDVNQYAYKDVMATATSAEWEDSLLALVSEGVFSALVLSPGPGRPDDYPLSRRLLRQWPRTKPVLGVCLGHQLLLVDAGCSLQQAAPIPVHGRSQRLHQTEAMKWLKDVTLEEQECTFYNSWNVLSAEAYHRAPQWRVCAAVRGSGVFESTSSSASLMSAVESVALCEHRENPWIGVQFHPESFATVPGKPLLSAFVALCRSGA